MEKTTVFGVAILALICSSVSYATTSEVDKIDDQELTPVEYFCQVCGDCPSSDDEKLQERYEKKHAMKKYHQCLDKPIIGDHGISECTWEEVGRQEVVLNQKYKKLMNNLPQNQKIALRNHQRQWIKERDRKYECIGYTHGTIDDVNQSAFYLHQTIKRVDEFDQCLSAKTINRSSKGCEYLYPLK